uniref:Uncharacterized protein n=1 Tax=Plectus sambesii TaxID=2011161 RepID=A0A914WGN8_9BILA
MCHNKDEYSGSYYSVGRPAIGCREATRDGGRVGELCAAARHRRQRILDAHWLTHGGEGGALRHVVVMPIAYFPGGPID